MIKKILFVLIPMLFLLPFNSVKAAEQNYSIDVYSFTYGGLMGDLNTGCSFQTKTTTLSNNFTQYINFYSGGYCDTTPSGMTIGMNVTTNITAGSYYTITQTLQFEGSIQYLQENINLYTQCGVFTSSGWNMAACDDVVVTATPSENGSANIIYTFKPKVNGTKYTFTVGSLREGYQMFYAVGNGGRFRMTSLKVDKSDDPIVGIIGSLGQQNNTIINQNQTIIDQNNEINNNLGDINDSITSDNVDDFSDTINSFEGFLEENSTITKLVTLPVTLYSSILNNINTTCTPFNLGTLYGEPLILPCINIGNYLGATLWGMIDLIISGFAIYAISKKFIKIFNNFSTLKEGDILDD